MDVRFQSTLPYLLLRISLKLNTILHSLHNNSISLLSTRSLGSPFPFILNLFVSTILSTSNLLDRSLHPKLLHLSTLNLPRNSLLLLPSLLLLLNSNNTPIISHLLRLSPSPYSLTEFHSLLSLNPLIVLPQRPPLLLPNTLRIRPLPLHSGSSAQMERKERVVD